MISGFAGALLIGLILGLIGGGGSILTLPIFVYLLDIDPLTATSYSLFVVGVTASFGTIKNYFNGTVNFKIGFYFAVPSLIAVFLTRKVLIPLIPEVLLGFQGYVIYRDKAILVLFALLMFAAAYYMIRNKKVINNQEQEIKYWKIGLEGLIVGLLTGLVGAGGGFLIIPALVILANLDMRVAVGTSLFIISIKSLIGFLGDLTNLQIDWYFLLTFSFISILGIFLGTYLIRFIESNQLKKIFGWFVLVLSVFILFRELLM